MGAAQHAGIFLPAIVLALVLKAAALAAPPDATSLFPAGGSIGTSVAVTATGTFNAWPVQIMSSSPKVQGECEKDKGKLKIHIAPDAEPGLYWLRFVDDEGASAPRPFVVAAQPSVLEKEPNDAAKQAQQVTASVVVQGKFDKNGDSDSYRIELAAGETIVASLQANSILGSPADGALQICSADGQVLAMNQDAGGLDSLLAFKATVAGSYLVRTFALPATPNSSVNFAGGELFIYRLTITTGSFADYVLPLAVAHEGTTPLKLFGWNLPAEPVALAAPISLPTEPWYWTPPNAVGLVPLKRVTIPLVVAANEATTKEGQTINVPACISGVITNPRDVHRFAFEGKKGSKLSLVAESANLNFDLDPHLKLIAPDGKTVAEADDSGRDRDPSLNVTLASDGQYVAEIRDLHRTGGPRHVYRLTIETPQPRLALTVAAGSFLLEPGKPLEVPVTINRQNGFSGEVNVAAVDLPAGVTAIFATSQAKGDTAKAVKVTLTATTEAKPGPIRIVAQDTDEKELATATFAQTLGGSTFQHSQLWLAVKPPKEKP